MRVEPRADLMILSGIVNRAVHDPELRGRPGAVTQDIFARYQQSYLEAGQEVPRLSIFEVNALRSVYAAQYHAESRLGDALATYRATGLNQQITSSMMARDVDAGPQSGYGVPAQVTIRFRLQTDVEGEASSRWVSYQPLIAGPDQIADLLEMAEAAGRALAEDYGEDFIGVEDEFSITWA